MNILVNFINEESNNMSSLNLEYEYKQDELLGEIEEYFSASDDWNEDICNEVENLLKKIPSNKMFGLLSIQEDDYDLVCELNDFIQQNKNIKLLSEVKTELPSLVLYMFNSKYIIKLNSDQDLEYFISK